MNPWRLYSFSPVPSRSQHVVTKQPPTLIRLRSDGFVLSTAAVGTWSGGSLFAAHFVLVIELYDATHTGPSLPKVSTIQSKTLLTARNRMTKIRTAAKMPAATVARSSRASDLNRRPSSRLARDEVGVLVVYSTLGSEPIC